ncbi:MAG: hypothetical protein QHH24_03060 [Candidatus Bathyarchaeota archaeon]|nr:hypothetical protein [Candidatus Bathyarchaeota archaeon]
MYTTGESAHYRRIEDECFGIPRGGTVFGLAIGIVILLAGLFWFLRNAFPDSIFERLDAFPVAVMIFGILIVIGALYALRRRY